MVENSTFECGLSQPAPRRSFMLALCVLCAIAVAAQTQQNSVEAYANAIQQSTVAGQIAAMERYLAIAENGILKHDALEVLIWDYTRTGSVEHVKQRAQELLRLDPNNPVAIGMLEENAAEESRPAEGKSGASEKAAKARIARLKSALVALENLRKPEGMQAGDFAALRRHVEARLEGALGMIYAQQEEYQQAKTPLQEAVTSDPGNAQYAYALGLALLLAKEPDPARAYFYLARAANLTRGTPLGQQIAEFGRKRYRKAGGNDADWNKFLAAAAVPQARQAPLVGTAMSPPPSTVPPHSGQAAPTPGANVSAQSPASAHVAGNASSAAGAKSAPNSTATTPQIATNPAQETRQTSPALPNAPPPLPRQSQMAALTPPDVNRSSPKPEPAPVISSPNPPVSLVILVETALLTGRNRPMIFSALRDVVQHLRPGDEAALLVFSNQLDFEQDLTANPALLTDAMESLRPKSGAALLEGVAFAAGHLKRIGKNATRVLLVISDGRSARLKPELPPLSAQINGVRIDCIGLDVEDESGRNLLQSLASESGGRVVFVRGPEQFRMAAAQITSGIGLGPR